MESATYPVVVDDLNDHGDFAGVGTGFEEDHYLM